MQTNAILSSFPIRYGISKIKSASRPLPVGKQELVRKVIDAREIEAVHKFRKRATQKIAEVFRVQ